jgi:hypothetical protein
MTTSPTLCSQPQGTLTQTVQFVGVHDLEAHWECTECNPYWYNWYCHQCKRTNEVLRWTPTTHFGHCGQSCGCCRSEAGDRLGCCEECENIKALRSTSRGMRTQGDHTEMIWQPRAQEEDTSADGRDKLTEGMHNRKTHQRISIGTWCVQGNNSGVTLRLYDMVLPGKQQRNAIPTAHSETTPDKLLQTPWWEIEPGTFRCGYIELEDRIWYAEDGTTRPAEIGYCTKVHHLNHATKYYYIPHDDTTGEWPDHLEQHVESFFNTNPSLGSSESFFNTRIEASHGFLV